MSLYANHAHCDEPEDSATIELCGSIGKMQVLGLLKLLPILSNETGYRYLGQKEPL
ncbi:MULTISPECIES: hypothetical protein [unclassified Paenibacillus]|uniref:hypothetical protein n=1 Tax=unclassified Paenibacillus TaxID=185978 RepID=UPI000A3E126E|nr:MULTISPECIES: hypothetical protein [unclassified Paenibacillus]